MDATFYIAASVAVLATAVAITRTNTVHALLYVVVSLLAVALVFYLLRAPLAAALEVIVYAGAIMVLFIFVVMMLNVGEAAALQERRWMEPGGWIGAAVLALVLLVELGYLLAQGDRSPVAGPVVGPEQVGIALFGSYLLAVELASMLLLAGLIAAYHVGRSKGKG
jgi:NADH-quinone oxidoreductase subunit J